MAMKFYKLRFSVLKEMQYFLIWLVLLSTLLSNMNFLESGTAIASTQKTFTDRAISNCIDAALPNWSQLENSVWERICRDEPAKINELVEPRIECPYKQKSTRYPAELILSSSFLERILQKDLLAKTPPAGVRVLCAYFPEYVVLDNYTLIRPVTINRSLFGKFLHLRNTTAEYNINFRRTRIVGSLLADEIRSNGSLLLLGLDVGRDLNLSGARIDGRLHLEQATVGCNFDAEAIQVGRHIELWNGGPFNRVSLVHAKIGNFLQLRGSTFNGAVNLTGAEIKGELHIASNGKPPPVWGQKAKLILRNTSVNALQDLSSHWPDVVDLVGFQYQIPGGLRGGGETTLGERSVSELLSWLTRQQDFGTNHYAQPYKQLAGVLEDVGRTDKARVIRFFEKLHELRADSTPLSDKLWLVLTGVILGFGIYPGISGIWLVLLTFTGWYVAARANYSIKHPTVTQSLWFAVDTSIPVISLGGKKHDEIFEAMDIHNRQQVYLQKLLAFVLFTFFAASITGLIK